jgi:hypothetical protein
MAGKKQDNEDTRDVFEKALDKPEYALTPEQSIAALTASIAGGLYGGKAIARRLASKATRKAEAEAMARAAKDGSLGYGRGKDAKVLDALSSRVNYGRYAGGAAGGAAGVYAGTRRKERD